MPPRRDDAAQTTGRPDDPQATVDVPFASPPPPRRTRWSAWPPRGPRRLEHAAHKATKTVHTAMSRRAPGGVGWPSWRRSRSLRRPGRHGAIFRTRGIHRDRAGLPERASNGRRRPGRSIPERSRLGRRHGRNSKPPAPGASHARGCRAARALEGRRRDVPARETLITGCDNPRLRRRVDARRPHRRLRAMCGTNPRTSGHLPTTRGIAAAWCPTRPQERGRRPSNPHDMGRVRVRTRKPGRP